MDLEAFKNLAQGDLIMSAGSDRTVFIVTANYGDRVTAVMTKDLTNASEWELLAKADYQKRTDIVVYFEKPITQFRITDQGWKKY